MDTSVALPPHHREWLYTQLVKHRSSCAASSSPWPAPPPLAQPPSWPPLLSPSPTLGLPSLLSPDSPSWESEGATLSDPAWDDGDLPTASSSPSSGSTSPSDSSSWGASSSPYRGPSSASSDPWMPGNQPLRTPASSLDVAVPVETASFADDVFMDPVIDYISDMIVHGNMEGRNCMEHECLSFQATRNGTPENGCWLQPSDSAREYGNIHGDPLGLCSDALADYAVQAADRWVDTVLMADPVAEGPFARVGAATDSFFHNAEDEEDLRTGLPFLYQSVSFHGPFGPSQALSSDSSLSGSGLSSFSSNDMGKRSLTSPRLSILPATNHEYVTPTLPMVTSNQEIVINNGAFFSDSLLATQAQSAGGTLTQKTFESMPNISFSAELQINSPFPLLKTVDALFSRSNLSVNGLHHPSAATFQQPLSFVKNEYLKAEKHAKMYGDWWRPDQAVLAFKKKRPQSGSGKRNGKTDPVDLRSLLVDCAQAVGANNLRKANEIVSELRQHISPDGTAAQRLAHYFTEALVARLAGTGAQQYTVMSANRPSAAETLKALCVILEVCPYAKLAHFFANRNILKVAEGASRLHIVDYGILYGVQWPALISALAERNGGPPHLRITGIDFPQPGLNPAERVEETMARLAEYAKAYNVPFEYQAIAKKWEDVEPADLKLREGEVLAVNCVHRLRHLMDETVVTANTSPRRKVLSRIRSLNPAIVVIAVLNAGFNAPFFVSRFREALYHYSSKFDIIDSTVGEAENPQRRMMERACLARDILNIVACEGHERVERPETYRQWQARFQRAGFEPLRQDQSFLKKCRDVVRCFYHRDFSVDDDSKWMLLGWKGRIMEGLSAWRPSTHVSVF